MPAGTMPYSYQVISSDVGRTKVLLDCPWCHDQVEAFLWSLAGSGKRCTNPACRAKFSYDGRCTR